MVLGMIINHPNESVTQNMPQNLNYHASEWESYERQIKMRTKFLRASHKHVCPSTNTRGVAQRHAPTL